jgi:hypothetical protein
MFTIVSWFHQNIFVIVQTCFTCIPFKTIIALWCCITERTSICLLPIVLQIKRQNNNSMLSIFVIIVKWSTKGKLKSESIWSHSVRSLPLNWYEQCIIIEDIYIYNHHTRMYYVDYIRKDKTVSITSFKSALLGDLLRHNRGSDLDLFWTEVFCWRSKLLTRGLTKDELKSSLQKMYSHHHEVADRLTIC